jgi:hypothetical protein
MRSALQWLLMIVIVLNGPVATAYAHSVAGGTGLDATLSSAASDAQDHCAGMAAGDEQLPEPSRSHDSDSCQFGMCHCGCAGVTAVMLPELAIATHVPAETVSDADDACAPIGRVAAPFRPPTR